MAYYIDETGCRVCDKCGKRLTTRFPYLGGFKEQEFTACWCDCQANGYNNGARSGKIEQLAKSGKIADPVSVVDRQNKRCECERQDVAEELQTGDRITRYSDGREVYKPARRNTYGWQT